jgi:LacI family transcriptional regulator
MISSQKCPNAERRNTRCRFEVPSKRFDRKLPMNLKELSKSLGLSQTTVSRALNGYPEVRAVTRARVLAAAAAANYLPNSRACRLATERSMTIGHVIPLSSGHAAVNPIFADIIADAGEVYAREGYDMLLPVVPKDAEERTYREMSTNGSVDGILVHNPSIEDGRVALLQEIDLPLLMHGRASDSAGYSWLDTTNLRAFRRATDFLLDLGHRRIALINGVETMDFAARRRRGFLEALSARGVTTNPEWMTSHEMTEGSGYPEACRMLDSDTAPTTFLTSSVLIAIGVGRAVSDRGLKLGRDISLITHDDALLYLNNNDDGPAFTATRSSIREAGAG